MIGHARAHLCFLTQGVEFYVAAASSEVQHDSEQAGDWQALLDAGLKRKKKKKEEEEEKKEKQRRKKGGSKVPQQLRTNIHSHIKLYSNRSQAAASWVWAVHWTWHW